MSTFSVTLDGRTASVPLETARAACPDEVAALELAGERVAAVAQSGDQRLIDDAAFGLEKSMRAVLHALADAQRKKVSDVQ